MTDTRVVIVGAGPVGLCAALALTQKGIGVRVLEAEASVDTRMRASTFHPPTLDILASLGVGDALLQAGLKVPCFQMRQHESGEFVDFDLGVLHRDTHHPYRLQVEQHKLCELAIQSLASDGVEVDFNMPVTDIQQLNHQVLVTVNGRQNPISADWLIGADGANSIVRQSLGLSYGGKTYTHSSVLVLVDFAFEAVMPNIKPVSYCWSERGPFSLLKLKKLWRVSLYPGVESLDDAANEDGVREWLEYIHPQARNAEILDISPYRVHERCVENFRCERVFLAGDAAHLNPPSGGMGMNGGIHDVNNLASKLQKVIDGASDKMLDRYHVERHGLVSRHIIPQASANRERMAATDRSQQTYRLQQLRSTAADADKCYEFLLKSSMITGLREAQNIE